MQLETGLSVCVGDFDFTSIYPNNMRALNTSRMTLTFVPYEIVGRRPDELRRYFTNLVNVRENASVLCHDFHSLPSYEGMKNLVESKLKGVPT